ncbi:MAG: hypothetical protein ACRD8A_15690 [Candidatus Acidiferrales bacterium]
MALRNRGRVFGLYRDFPSLRLGVDTLKALSFTNQDISVLLPEKAVSDTLPGDQCLGIGSGNSSAFIGGALGWLTYVRPDAEGVIAGALVTLGISPLQAGTYENQLRSGLLFVSILSRTSAQVDNASAVLIATGAESVIASLPARPSHDRTGARKLLGSVRLAETLFTC